MATIHFSHISKSFASGTDAVKNFCLDVRDGEFLVIVGPSGCGKSTLLRLVAGLDEITSGELEIDGKIINDMDPGKRNIAMVFQNYALFPNMTVEKNMEFALKVQRVPKKERATRVREMAQILGVSDILNRKAKGLSGGQCQRIAIGRALVCQPRVFLLDEPLSNLDAAMRGELRAQIAELQKRLQITTLYVTHDLTEAMTLGNRIVVMNQGEIMQVDTPQNIYCRPQNIFTANFIGGSSMNLFEAVCVNRNGVIGLEADGIRIPIPDYKSQRLMESGYADKTVIAGIRSEDVYAECEGTVIPENASVVISSEVTSVDILGAEKRLHVAFAGADFTCQARSYAAVAPGSLVRLHLAADQIHIFDKETEQAVVH